MAFYRSRMRSGFRVRLGYFALLFFTGCLAALAGTDTAEAASVLTIRDDAEGGDCKIAGAWDRDSRTCSLTADASYLFVIASDGITFDGAGHTLTGSGPADPAYFIPGPDGGGFGIDLSGRSNVTVRNINLTRHDYGIHLSGSSHNTVVGVTSSMNGLAGISLSYSTGNTIAGNTLSNPGPNTGICVGYGSSGNVITENDISGFDRGIYLHDASNGNEIAGNRLNRNYWGVTLKSGDHGNLISGNEVSAGLHGIWLLDASGGNEVTGNEIFGNIKGLVSQQAGANRITGNNFRSSNSIPAEVSGGGASFSAALPAGGNYWESFDEPAEGCLDVLGDGFCDAPYSFAGAQDALPRTAEAARPCNTPALVISSRGSWWNSYADYRVRQLSVQFLVRNEGISSAGNVYIESTVCDSGVESATPLPALISSGIDGGSQSTPVLMSYHVPEGVSLFRVMIHIAAQDPCNGTHRYPFEPGGF